MIKSELDENVCGCYIERLHTLQDFVLKIQEVLQAACQKASWFTDLNHPSLLRILAN